MTIIKKTYCLLLAVLYSTILQAQDSHWTVNIYDYQYDMSVYAQLMDDGVVISNYDKYEIAAFVGDECRGIAEVQSATKDGQTYTWLYIRVRSNVASGETVTFKAYDKTEDETLKIAETIAFSSQGSIGLPSSPFNLNIARFTPGDVNDDGKILLNDATMIINNVIGKQQANFNESAADFNGDGKILLNDATMIINKIIGK